MKKIRSVAAGAAGGLLGAALMGLAYAAVAKLTAEPPPDGEDATEKVANAVAKTVARTSLKRSKKKLGGQVVHYAFGAAMGALYGLLAETFPPLTAGAGTLFGSALYGGAHGIAVPALGLARSPAKNKLIQEAPELVAHLVYGVATETVRRVLA